MSAYDLYHTWNPKIRELLPHERVTRVRNVTWMLVGLHLSDIARKLPFDAKLNSTTDRFRRFLSVAGIDRSLRICWPGQRKVDCGWHQGRCWPSVAVAYRKRALPIAWTSRGHSSTDKQRALLSHVRTPWYLPGSP
jgi:hypothetical protein